MRSMVEGLARRPPCAVTPAKAGVQASSTGMPAKAGMTGM